MRAGALALLALLIPAVAEACRTAPHTAHPFHTASFAALPGCDDQWLSTCQAQGATAAWYEAPTDRYAHGVLGDAIEGGTLRVYSSDAAANSCGTKSAGLNTAHVFEDTAPRLSDLDGDGQAEIIVVRSHRTKGAQLAVYTDVPGHPDLRLTAQTPYIGRANRWLAPIGAADLDGDGHMEIAYIDRPHLAKTLRIWRYKNGQLREVATQPGLTNHKIGWDVIAGGLRHCDGSPELITANATWTRIIATTFDGRSTTSREIADYTGPDSLTSAMTCD